MYVSPMVAEWPTWVKTYAPLALKWRSSVNLCPAVNWRQLLCARDRQAGHGLLLHPDGGGAGVVLEDVLDVAGPVAPARGDAVEALGVAAGVVVNLQLVVARDLESVADGSHLHRGEHGFDGLEVLAGQLEAAGPRACTCPTGSPASSPRNEHGLPLRVRPRRPRK